MPRFERHDRRRLLVARLAVYATFLASIAPGMGLSLLVIRRFVDADFPAGTRPGEDSHLVGFVFAAGLAVVCFGAVSGCLLLLVRLGLLTRDEARNFPSLR